MLTSAMLASGMSMADLYCGHRASEIERRPIVDYRGLEAGHLRTSRPVHRSAALVETQLRDLPVLAGEGETKRRIERRAELQVAEAPAEGREFRKLVRLPSSRQPTRATDA